MTLILAALYKDGACVCADKKEKTQHINGTLIIRDDLYKIHKFNDIPLIIYNHGVNKFGNKSWSVLCSEYENSKRWSNCNLKQISDDFRDFIKVDIKQQLGFNINNFPNNENYKNSFFNLIGKNHQYNRFEMYELRWFVDSTGLHLESDLRRAFVRSGDGKKYLEDYIKSKSKINCLNYWENMDIVQAKNKLISLFNIAVAEKKRLGGDEFSDNFDLEFIT